MTRKLSRVESNIKGFFIIEDDYMHQQINIDSFEMKYLWSFKRKLWPSSNEGSYSSMSLDGSQVILEIDWTW